MKIPVTYAADGWQHICTRPDVEGEFQRIMIPIDDDHRLFVELVRYPWAPPRVAVARVEKRSSGRKPYATISVLHETHIVLAEAS